MGKDRTLEIIKTEVESLKSIEYPCDNSQQATGFFNALDRMTDFLDTLESETTYDAQQYTPRPSVSIEDVARVQFASHAKVFDKKRKAVFDWEQFKEVAGIFYCFGKKDHSDTLDSEKPMNQDEDLNEEIKRFVAEYGYERSDDILLIAIVARHFTEWQKEQIMKGAIHYVVQDDLDSHGASYNIPSIRIGIAALKPKVIGVGDKVRIIIVKEDEK